jgi:hypothetical protein
MAVTKGSLSSQRRHFLTVLQRINFGTIECLEIRNGEPYFTPNTRLRRQRRFPGDNGPRAEVVMADFVLKAQVVELFRTFDEIGNGIVETLEVLHGLPFKLVTVEDAAF